eukprot:Gb_17113 [translate_table: standard]
MKKGLLGAAPFPVQEQNGLDGNKRKRADGQAQHKYIDSMIQGNPKMLLAEYSLFNGLTQHQLPFIVEPVTIGKENQYQARIKLPLPDGSEAWGMGMARTKKEAERLASVDACKQLRDMDLLGSGKNNSSNNGWGDNPKNMLVTSIAFRDICCGGNAKSLPITLRSSGPDHAKVFVAELTIPLRHKGDVCVAVGKGRNKVEAERACCFDACEKLYQEGLLNKPNAPGGTDLSETSTKALQIQQQNEQPAIVGLRDEELMMMEDALRHFHLDVQSSSASLFPPDSVWNRTELSEFGIMPEGASQFWHAATCSVSKEQMSNENAMLCLEARQRALLPEIAKKRLARQSLPAWQERQKIIDAVVNNRVIVLTGETGCGKTTQVPQFILEEAEMQGIGAEVHIIVTQPRRIAAISVAERVAWERGESIGKSVGYTVRLNSVPPRLRGSILYCTTGILLRRLQTVDGMVGVSHVIIDEVHERDVDTDFLLVVVREMLQHHPSLRVVIMSATLDATIFIRYFGGCPLVNIRGMIHPVTVHFLEDLSQLMGQSFPGLARPKLSDEEEVDTELVALTLAWLAQDFAQGNGAILCFLPGWDIISAVKDRLIRMPASRGMTIVPLHSQLPAGEQRAVFALPSPGTRKVVLATNIAETSITIDDVVYVVDSGKIKEKQFDASRNLTTLRIQWTSKASACQRQGRAGRVQAGYCLRLYTRDIFLTMQEHQMPEMQRVPLEELCLQIKAISSTTAVAHPHVNGKGSLHGSCNTICMSNIKTFLSKALQPPTAPAVCAAIKVLQELGAIDPSENLTPLGKTLAKLAVHPRFGKMLVYGALLGCLDPLLTMASSACFRDPFTAPSSRRNEADRVRRGFAVGPAFGSDHLALVNAFQQWFAANSTSTNSGYAFCDRNFLAPMTMRLIAGMRKQFQRTLGEAGIAEPWISISNPEAAAHVARSLLAAGLYPNIAKSEICRESKGMKNATKHAYRWRLGFRVESGRVFIHPTSVVSEKLLDSNAQYYIAFQEKVQTSQLFVRGCSLLPPLAVVLLGWNVRTNPNHVPPNLGGDWMLLEVEGWMKFLIDRKAGALLLQLRRAFDEVLARWVSGSARVDAERYIVEVVVTLLGATCHDMLLGVSGSGF